MRAASGLKWFRTADTRHTGATRLAEAGVDTRIIARRMGHCGVKMQEHYTHLNQQAERMWLRHMPTLQFHPGPAHAPRPASPVYPSRPALPIVATPAWTGQFVTTAGTFYRK